MGASETQHIPLVIVGSGPAGLTAAIYAARAKLNPMVIRGLTPGGLMTSSEQIENFPGFPEGISGFDLAFQMEKQAALYGTQFLDAFVTAVHLDQTPFQVLTDDGGHYTADGIIVSTGATPRPLGIPGEQEFMHAGVEHCATCDGPVYTGKTVVVVGGGNTALTDALQLSRYAEKVLLVHRSQLFRAEPILQDRVLQTPNIEVLWNTRVLEILGQQEVEEVRVCNALTGQQNTLKTSGVFVCIGSSANTDLFVGQLDLNPDGTLKTDERTRTSVPGVYAAGDVADALYRQAITSAGQGAKAALEAIHSLIQQPAATTLLSLHSNLIPAQTPIQTPQELQMAPGRKELS